MEKPFAEQTNKFLIIVSIHSIKALVLPVKEDIYKPVCAMCPAP
jgi:hypothetical protein